MLVAIRLSPHLGPRASPGRSGPKIASARLAGDRVRFRQKENYGVAHFATISTSNFATHHPTSMKNLTILHEARFPMIPHNSKNSLRNSLPSARLTGLPGRFPLSGCTASRAGFLHWSVGTPSRVLPKKDYGCAVSTGHRAKLEQPPILQQLPGVYLSEKMLC